MKVITFNIERIMEFLKNLSDRSAPGSDGIPAVLLKKVRLGFCVAPVQVVATFNGDQPATFPVS